MITREEMVTMLYRYAMYKEKTEPIIDDYKEKHVNTVVSQKQKK